MPAIPLFGIGIASKSPTVTAKLLTNFYAEARPVGEKSQLVCYGTPGLELFADLTDIARGGLEFEKNSVAYVVAGDTLYEVNQYGVATNRGTLLTSSGRVSMAHNGTQIMIVDGIHGYIYNTATIVFAQITDPDFPANPMTVTYLSRRFIVSLLNSSRFYVSDIDDGLGWDGLAFANAESNPDPIVAVWASNGQLVLLGANTTEFWGNSGTNDFPFVALQGTANEWGLAAVSSLAKYDNTFACLIKNRMGQVMVAKMHGYLPKPISTLDIDHIVNAYFANQDAFAYSYMLGGHPMYVVNFPSAASPTIFDNPISSDEEAAEEPECEPEPPDPIPDRYLYLGDTETAGATAPITTLSTDTKWVWTAAPNFFAATVDVTVTSDVGEAVIATFSEAVTLITTKGIADVESIGEVWVLGAGWPLPIANRHAHIFRFSAGTAAIDGSAAVAPAYIGEVVLTDDFIDPQMIGYDPVTQKVWIAYAQSNAAATTVCIIEPSTMTTDETISNTDIGVIGFPTQFVFGYPYVGLVGTQGGSNPNFVIFDATAPYAVRSVVTVDAFREDGKVCDYDSVRARFFGIHVSSKNIALIDAATGTTSVETLAYAADADTVPPPIAAAGWISVTYFSRLDLYMFCVTSDLTHGSSLTIVNPATFEAQSTYTYETGTNMLIGTMFEPLTGDDLGNYVLVFDATHVKRYYFGEACPPDAPPAPPAPTPGESASGGGPLDGETWLYDGSTGFWSKLKSLGITRHRVQFSFQLAGMTIGTDYNNGKLYRITDTALSDNGDAIEGEIIGETLVSPDESFITVHRLRVAMETGVGISAGQGVNPQVALSIARDSGAKLYGPEMWKPLGAAGEFYTRLEWRRLGTTRYFTAKLRITDPVKRVVVSASVNPED